MKIKCPACSKVLSVPESAAGKIVKCPCGKQLRAPTGAASPSTGAAAGAVGGPGAQGRPSASPGPARPASAAGDFDPDMFDELTDQDLKPVKSSAGPKTPVAAPGVGGGKLLKQYAPRDAMGGKREIASVGSRIVGAIVDGLLVSVFNGIAVGVVLAVVATGGEQPSSGLLAGAIAGGSVIALIPAVINGILISKSGQSVGKKLVGTRMVDQSAGTPVGFVQGFLVRSVVFQLIVAIPLVGLVVAIADIIYLFRDNHQTLHDKLAKTLVVKA